MKKNFMSKRVLAFMLTVTLLLGCAAGLGMTAYAATPSFDGYIKNGDFEIGSAGNWTMGGTSSIVKGGHDGSPYCLRLSGGIWTNIIQEVAVEPNTDYRLSGWVKREAGTGAHYLFAKDGSTQCTAINGTQQWFRYPDNKWVQHTFEFNSKSASKLQIAMCIEDPNSVFLYDDIILQKLSDVKQEGTIVNGGFETGNGANWLTGGSAVVTDAYNGSGNAMKLTGNAGVALKQTVNVKGLTDYRLTVHAKRYRSSGTHTVVVLNGDKTVEFKNGADGVISETAREWREYVYEFNSGYASQLTVAMKVADTNAAFIYDDIILEEIPAPDYSSTRKGDVTLNDNIDSDDLALLNKHIAGETALEGAAFYAADMDSSGAVNEADAALLGKYLESGSVSAVPIYPINGDTVAKASWQAAVVVEEYTPCVTDDYSGITQRKDTYMRDPVVLKWMYGGAGDCTVLLADNAKLNGAKSYTVSGNELSIQNLMVDTDYYWAVEVGGIRSDVGRFHTEKTVRTFWIDGVSNTRDMGGWLTEDGGYRVKYNAAVRGGRLDTITDAGRAAIAELGIKTQVELRAVNDGAEAVLGDKVKFIRAGTNGAAMYYNVDNRTMSDFDGDYVKGTTNAFRAFADADNYPIYFNCSHGRDRTGTLGFLLLGVLGVSREDIYKDYELTFLSVYGGYHLNAGEHIRYLDSMFEWMQQTYAPEGTLKEAVEGYLLAAGITEAEIAAVRANLLEPVPGEAVATGDLDGDNDITVTDALAALRIAVGLAPETPELISVGDMDSDGSITVSDALRILRCAVRKR